MGSGASDQKKESADASLVSARQLPNRAVLALPPLPNARLQPCAGCTACGTAIGATRSPPPMGCPAGNPAGATAGANCATTLRAGAAAAGAGAGAAATALLSVSGKAYACARRRLLLGGAGSAILICLLRPCRACSV